MEWGAPMITVSVCMIVKNEEAVLERALLCLKKIADEIIVVDTGSTDATKEIAARYTDKIYDFTWVDDFSSARNYAFSKATMEYIYSADADEVIEESEIERFLALKKTLSSDIEIVQMLYTNQLQFSTTYNFDEELRPMLYKRLRPFVWQEPVHETVRLTPVVLDTDIRIKHMPLSNHSGRDFATFQKAIVRDGTLSDRLTGMYARELYLSGTPKDFKESIPFFVKKSEECADAEMLKKCYSVLAHAAVCEKDVNLLLKSAMKQAVLGEPTAELCYDLGEYFFSCGDYYEAVLWYYNALYETEAELSRAAGGVLPARKLAECYRLLNDREKEAQYSAIAKEKENER